VPVDRLLTKIAQGEVALGVLGVMSSPEAAMTLAACDLDYVVVDQMFTSTDWDRTAHIIRAARASGISPLVRLPSDPWIGGTPGLAAQCMRAQGVGATGVLASCADAAEVSAVVEAGKDWHRDIHVVKFEEMDDYANHAHEAGERTVAAPVLESQKTVAEFEECLSVEGLRTAFIGLSDLSIVLGHPFEYEHPEVWAMVDEIAAICRRRGIVLGANTGYEFRTPDSIAQRVQRLTEHGVGIVMLQTDAALLQMFTSDIVRATKVLLDPAH
jgi:2-keto-3-deoxy-L-rhamnonate aldolase RhmA